VSILDPTVLAERKASWRFSGIKWDGAKAEDREKTGSQWLQQMYRWHEALGNSQACECAREP
jgi:hypothetical protein